jgi:uncharacterized delta-60 repeat protein
MARQRDSKLLIGFTNGPFAIERLNESGSLDSTFQPVLAFEATITNRPNVRSILVQPDDRIVISGHFTLVNGQPRTRIARLNADGSLDADFNTGAGLDQGAAALILQPDGRIIVGGRFTNVDDVVSPQLARLNSDGSLDRSFNIGAGPDGPVDSIAFAGEGKLMVAGAFSSFDSVPAPGLARLSTGLTAGQFHFIAHDTNHVTELRVAGNACRSYLFEASTDLVHWTTLGTNGPTAGEIIVRETNTASHVFYRAWQRTP